MSRNDQLFLGTIWNDKKEPKCCVIPPPPLNGGDFVSITDYGAVGDGVTDNLLSIQAALDSGSPTVLFPAGTYAIIGTLRVPSNTTIIGYGSTLLRISNTTAMMLNDADGVTGGYDANENIKIYGLAFNGNGAIYPTSATLLAIGHAKHITIVDCEFYNIPGYHGIEINGTRDAVVQGCKFHDMLNGSEFLQFDVMNGPGLFPWFGPFDNTLCEGMLVTGCTFYDGAAGVGSHSGNDLLQHKYVNITNNVFQNLTIAAVGLYTYQHVVVANNVINNVRFGIVGGRPGMTLTRNYVIVGNVISNITNNTDGSNGVWGKGIEFYSIKDLVISHNQFDKVNAHGIDLIGCTRFKVTDNQVKDYGGNTVVDTYAVRLNNTSEGVIANNIFTEDPTGYAASNTAINVVSGGGTNVTIENNTITTNTSTFAFNGLTGNSIIVGTNTLNSKITPFISSKTADYTYTPTDSVLNVDTSAGNINITINPKIFNKVGLTVRKTTADVNTVTITPSSGTINGVASITLTTQNQVALITSDWVNLDATIK